MLVSSRSQKVVVSRIMFVSSRSQKVVVSRIMFVSTRSHRTTITSTVNHPTSTKVIVGRPVSHVIHAIASIARSQQVVVGRVMFVSTRSQKVVVSRIVFFSTRSSRSLVGQLDGETQEQQRKETSHVG